MGLWDELRRNFKEGWAESNRKFEEEHGYPPDQEIQRSIEQGRENARTGRGPFGGRDGKQTDDKGKE